MKHAIVFGGTGMLAGATKWLIETTDHISIIGRNKHKLEQLYSDHDNSDLRLVTLDYKDNEALRHFMRQTIQTYGPIDLVVSWIHSVAPDAIPIILDELTHQEHQWRFVHIKGSSHDLSSILAEIPVPRNCRYCDVQLGFKVEANVSRWLTHKEISNGVISAIHYDKKKTVVGILYPWSKRP
ncbi:short-chain dehydrogenase [Salicibibacter cibarius]|uniref:Short-chain dehydrogenase n=1 Tax=Salicibibacter cibarius TaxID=2743000 RepID=A0A7T6Z2M9_9BACI|nr:short-chain dehydrogenase [Salicibibacter cibarius]QQK75567.1 short-chain dehydrogenase [Salicibibacter cibarius]